jgi:2-succinyl-5-enolpyruvyl-6-hydroxy-3-cyclohexene-1-carboxylate synthase
MAGNSEQGAGISQGSLGVSHVSVADANYLWSRDLLTALVQQGVRHAVISSGSRCTPLVLAASRTEGLRIWTHPDERSAGFMGLGIGKATRTPAALICTSGTAAANYLPAVIEARLSRTPLILLTADRPPELRHRGAPQTIDQIDLYGQYPLYFCDLPVPQGDSAERHRWMVEADRAVNIAAGYPNGPVHLNVPFREPLIPDPEQCGKLDTDIGAPPLDREKISIQTCPVPDADCWDRLAEKIRTASRGVVICGPQNSCDDLGPAVARLAAATGYPILADGLSQVRFGKHTGVDVISHFDLFLKNSQLAQDLAPEIVIRLGGLPTSKTLNLWLKALSIRNHVLIDNHDEFADPFDCATEKITSPLSAVGDEVRKRLNQGSSKTSEYASGWRAANDNAVRMLQSRRHETKELFAGDVVAKVFAHAPAGLAIYLSNSMAIRFAEAYAEAKNTSIRVLFNRGANGIDGVVSSAIGAAAALGGQVVLVTGDLSLLHDVNALLGARRYALDLKIVLLNDDGGGIFSFLPIAAHAEILEPLVAMPHGCDFGEVARFFGIPHQRFSTLVDFVNGYQDCLRRRGPEILEVQYDRKQSLRTSRAIVRQFIETDEIGL